MNIKRVVATVAVSAVSLTALSFVAGTSAEAAPKRKPAVKIVPIKKFEVRWLNADGTSTDVWEHMNQDLIKAGIIPSGLS